MDWQSRPVLSSFASKNNNVRSHTASALPSSTPRPPSSEDPFIIGIVSSTADVFARKPTPRESKKKSNDWIPPPTYDPDMPSKIPPQEMNNNNSAGINMESESEPSMGFAKASITRTDDQPSNPNDDQKDDEDEDDDLYRVIRIPSRQDRGYPVIISKGDDCRMLVRDKELQTRKEWNHLLVVKAFKHYGRRLIGALGEDSPSTTTREGLDPVMVVEDSLEPSLMKIRDEMLDNSRLSNDAVEAFFEAFKFFHEKLYCLQKELDRRNSAPRQLSIHTQNNDGSASASSSGMLPSEDSGASVLFASQPHKPASHDEDRPGAAQPVKSSQGSRSATSTQTGFQINTLPSMRKMSLQRIRQQTHGREGYEEIERLLDELEEAGRRQKRLEKQLAQAGVVITEDIPYDVAKERVASIAQRMSEIGCAESKDVKLREEYFLLEREMDKYVTALQLTDEWIEEQEEIERKWEESIRQANEIAITKIRRHMPVDVRNQTEHSLTELPTPNGRYLPRQIAKKFKRANVLQLLRSDPEDIALMHPATLENLRCCGLTLTERRALYHHLKDVAVRWKAIQGDKMTERKWTWFEFLKSRFKEKLEDWQRHVDQYGPPGNHPYFDRHDPEAGGCPYHGKQCALRADNAAEYDGDYGYPDGPEYFRSDIAHLGVRPQPVQGRGRGHGQGAGRAGLQEAMNGPRRDNGAEGPRGGLLQAIHAGRGVARGGLLGAINAGRGRGRGGRGRGGVVGAISGREEQRQ